MQKRAMLFLGIGLFGALMALGSHTPFYRFLVQTFPVMRAIRVPARWIVLFHLGLAVLAAFGLSALWKRRGPRARRLVAATALVLVGLEYRAAPLRVHAYDPEPPPVYRWIRGLSMPGAVVEWPVSTLDAEYVLRQADHGKPLVNGYSGFFPEPYADLQSLLEENPVPDAIWPRLSSLDASLLVLHGHDQDSLRRLRYVRLARRGVARGQLIPIGVLPHGEERDLVFRLVSATEFPASLPGGPEKVLRELAVSDAELAPPFGSVDIPYRDQEVEAGSWGYGWGIDDTGIAEVRIGTDLGGMRAELGGARPDLPAIYPDYPDAGTAGFGFFVPNLPPGTHNLVITIVGRDGGRFVIRRKIRIR
jgi:hypothetical protein